MENSDASVSLYVHVPFCTDKCLYCDFFSVPARGVPASIQERVVDQTIAQAFALIRAAGPAARVETVFIGGGTPSCLPPDLAGRLLGAFSALKPSEWTVEANPETLNEAFLETCRRSGVTRLSVGIQSLDAGPLRFLRRRATPEDCMRALALLQRHWHGDLNLDFITGIPGQSVADVRHDLTILNAARPTHVSLYQLTPEPGTPLAALVERREIVLNPAELDEELWFAGRDELIHRGHAQYEVSNFCSPGKECRHNLRYWRIEPYVGAGPAAVSTIPVEWARRLSAMPTDIPDNTAAVRIGNPKNIQEFLSEGAAFWGASVECVSPRDFLLETLMMGLRLSAGIAGQDFERRFGRTFAQLFPGLWEAWEGHGWAVTGGTRLKLTPEGLLLLDHLLSQVMERLHEPPLDGLLVRWPQ